MISVVETENVIPKYTDVHKNYTETHEPLVDDAYTGEVLKEEAEDVIQRYFENGRKNQRTMNEAVKNINGIIENNKWCQGNPYCKWYTKGIGHTTDYIEETHKQAEKRPSTIK